MRFVFVKDAMGPYPKNCLRVLSAAIILQTFLVDTGSGQYPMEKAVLEELGYELPKPDAEEANQHI